MYVEVQSPEAERISRGATLITLTSWHGFYRGRQEGSRGRWGLLPHRPAQSNTWSWKQSQRVNLHRTKSFAEQATSKHRHFALALRQPLDSSSLSHSLWYRCPFYDGNQSKQWPHSISPKKITPKESPYKVVIDNNFSESCNCSLTPFPGVQLVRSGRKPRAVSCHHLSQAPGRAPKTLLPHTQTTQPPFFSCLRLSDLCDPCS